MSDTEILVKRGCCMDCALADKRVNQNYALFGLSVAEEASLKHDLGDPREHFAVSGTQVPKQINRPHVVGGIFDRSVRHVVTEFVPAYSYKAGWRWKQTRTYS